LSNMAENVVIKEVNRVTPTIRFVSRCNMARVHEPRSACGSVGGATRIAAGDRPACRTARNSPRVCLASLAGSAVRGVAIGDGTHCGAALWGTGDRKGVGTEIY